MLMIAWMLTVSIDARACEPLKARALPEYGRPKESTADYKLINQSLRELLASVRRGDPVADGFVAGETPADWSGSPIKHGVLLTGPVPSAHALGAGEVRITVQRYPSGCVVHLKSPRGEWERYVPPGEFLRLFPWRGPGRLLESFARGVLDNLTLEGWAPFDPRDPLGTRVAR